MPNPRQDPDRIPGDNLRLVVTSSGNSRGFEFSGWESVEVARSIDSAAGSFALSVSGFTPWPIRSGDAVQLDIAGEPVITGHCDSMVASIDGKRRTVKVSGRDLAADLVDCSATNLPGEFVGLDLLRLAQEIARPYGVDVIAGSNLSSPIFPIFTLQQSESAWSAIERACRLRGFLAFSNASGQLQISKPAASSAEIDLRESPTGNVLAASVKISTKDRYSTYIVRGQAAGSDDGWGESVLAVEGRAADELVLRERTLVIIGEGPVTFASATDRAQWEATVRAARAAQLSVTVQGWRQYHPDGQLWRINQKVSVRIPSLQIEATMLIRSVKFARGNNGTVTELGLVRQDAYEPKPLVESSTDPFDDIASGEALEYEE